MTSTSDTGRVWSARGEYLPLNADTRRWLRGSYVALSEGITHYELTGPADASDVVFLAGSLTVPLFYWDQVVDRLHQRGLRTLTYSAYGRGYSDRVAAHYGPDLFVTQAYELLTTLTLPRRWHIVGSSMGALICLGLLGKIAEQTATLTLMGPAGLSVGSPLAARVAARRHVGPILGRRFGAHILRGHLRNNVSTEADRRLISDMVCDAYRCHGSMYSLLATLADFPLHGQTSVYEAAGRLQVPTMLLWGDQDRVTPPQAMVEAAQHLRPVRSEAVIDCGHMIPFEQPDYAATAIADFVQAAA